MTPLLQEPHGGVAPIPGAATDTLPVSPIFTPAHSEEPLGSAALGQVLDKKQMDAIDAQIRALGFAPQVVADKDKGKILNVAQTLHYALDTQKNAFVTYNTNGLNEELHEIIHPDGGLADAYAKAKAAEEQLQLEKKAKEEKEKAEEYYREILASVMQPVVAFYETIIKAPQVLWQHAKDMLGHAAVEFKHMALRYWHNVTALGDNIAQRWNEAGDAIQGQWRGMEQSLEHGWSATRRKLHIDEAATEVSHAVEDLSLTKIQAKLSNLVKPLRELTHIESASLPSMPDVHLPKLPKIQLPHL